VGVAGLNVRNGSKADVEVKTQVYDSIKVSTPIGASVTRLSLELSCKANSLVQKARQIGGSGGMRALIIEDQFLIATLIEDELRALGYTHFDYADSEEAAVDAAAFNCPDLITADQRLIGGSGVNAVRTICAERSIPVVFITEFRAEVRRSIPDALVIGKPFAEKTLHEAVKQAVLMQAGSSAGM
jgi:CheY-like chemotaxis protein